MELFRLIVFAAITFQVFQVGHTIGMKRGANDFVARLIRK